MRCLKIVFLLILLINISGVVMASQARSIDIENSEELILDFKGSRIRVETWEENHVKIEPTYLVKERYKLEVDANYIAFNKTEHLKKYPDDLDNNQILFITNEVYFVIKIPQHLKLSIYAENANIKENCQLKSLYARYARVRGVTFLKGFIGEGERINIRDSHYLGEKRMNYKKVHIENRKWFWGLMF